MSLPLKKCSTVLLVASIVFSLVNLIIHFRRHSPTVVTESEVNLSGHPTPKDLIVENNDTIVTKSILLWNAPHRPETLLFGAGRDVFRLHQCEVSDCELVLSHDQQPFRHQNVSSYDAIVFNFIDDFWVSRLPKQQERNPNQRYVFFTKEPPTALKNIEDVVYKVKFNWTMTYRHQSDVPLLYGRITPKEPRSVEEARTQIEDFSHYDFATNKTRLVAWMVSKCSAQSGREKYVKELRKFIQVDVYGECGVLQCEREELLSSHPDCYKMLESNYKFYLSFENSLCEDYVTESFFNVMNRDIVPIVFGAAAYSRIAPPHSYINAMDYEPRQLADYLKVLDANHSLYSQFFWWKKHYNVEAGLSQMVRNGFCELCKKLHRRHRVKSYSSRTIFSQWNQQQACRQNINYYPSARPTVNV